MQPRLESSKVTLAGKVKKWSGYKTCPDRRCFVFCDDLFRYIEHLDPIKAVFSEVYSSEAFDVLYLFGTFRELVDPGCYAVIELKASTRSGLMEISDRFFQVKTQRLYDLETIYGRNLWRQCGVNTISPCLCIRTDLNLRVSTLRAFITSKK